MTPTPAAKDAPPTKAAMATEVENILRRLRRGYLSQVHAPPLPPIKPALRPWTGAERTAKAPRAAPGTVE